MEAHRLELRPAEQTITLDLYSPVDRARSRVLHQLRGLGLPGYRKTGGSDFTRRDDLAQVWEQWRGRWSPEFEGHCIEAALYGATLTEAVGASLTERLAAKERDSEFAALALLDSALMGLMHLSPSLAAQMLRLIREDSDFFGMARALSHLLYLYHYDAVLGAAKTGSIGEILREAFARSLWLLETLGQVQGQDKALLEGIYLLVETLLRAGPQLDLDQEELVSIFQRIAADSSQPALLRGAAAGALWTLGRCALTQVHHSMEACAAPEKVGDFLTGLFHLARETAQRDAGLVESLDRIVRAYDADAFLEALPALRLAFAYFAPREKHYLIQTLMQPVERADRPGLASLSVSPEAAAQALVFEAHVFAALKKYGLRESSDNSTNEPKEDTQ